MYFLCLIKWPICIYIPFDDPKHLYGGKNENRGKWILFHRAGFVGSLLLYSGQRKYSGQSRRNVGSEVRERCLKTVNYFVDWLGATSPWPIWLTCPMFFLTVFHVCFNPAFVFRTFCLASPEVLTGLSNLIIIYRWLFWYCNVHNPKSWH